MGNSSHEVGLGVDGPYLPLMTSLAAPTSTRPPGRPGREHRLHRLPNRPRTRALALLPLAFLLSACGVSEDSGEWTVAVDTLPGGAVRVVNVPPTGGTHATWRLVEELRIGALEAAGPAAFGLLKGLAVLDDGRIAVLDAQAQELRLFGPDGRYLATFGGEGDGPGELRGAFGLMRDPEGRLWVPDFRNGRISVYRPERGYERSHPMRLLRRGFVWDGAILEDGRIVRPSVTMDAERRPLLRVFDDTWTQVDSVILPPPAPRDPEDPPGSFYWEAPDGSSRGYMVVPFYADAAPALDPRGVVWSTAEGDPAYRIFRWTPGGDTTLVIETRRPPVPVGEAERDSAIDAIRERLMERAAPGALDPSKIPRVKPAVRSLFVSEDGRLWVRITHADREVPLVYDIYERDGRRAGGAIGSVNPFEWVNPVVRGDRWWAIVTDDLGVHYVVRARLTPIR